MMFIVVTDIEGDHVKGAVVGVSLESLLEHVVLRDEVAGDGVKSHCHQRSAEKVKQHFTA